MSRLDKALLALAFGSLVFSCASLAGCATVKACAQPLSAQAIDDGAAVLACTAKGQALAACEDAQLSVEAGQLTSDLLLCGETAVVNASKAEHAK